MLPLMGMNKLAFVCVALAAVGCKKSSTTGTGGGGGGGWFTGSSGLMENVTPAGTPSHGYDLGPAATDLHGIACRYSGEAWVVGNAGTLLYTSDAGATWTPQAVPTKADLRTLATQDFGPVFIAGNGTFLMTKDTGKTWTELSDGVAAFRSLAAAQDGQTVLALSDDGGLWAYDGALTRKTTLAGMRAISVSPDGQLAIAAGNGMMRSQDGGATWTALQVDPSIAFDDVRIDEDGNAVAVGAGGAIANIDSFGAVSVQHVGTAALHTVHIADAADADPVGFAGGDGGQILVTHDNGLTWSLGAKLGGTIFGVDQIGDGHR
jgi:photosystem II stability/assembly factor-like uncharacterized protein